MEMEEALYPQFPVLLVDDEQLILNLLEESLRISGINNIITCQDSRSVLAIMETQEIEVILLDLSMPYLSGTDLLPKLFQDFPQSLVIVCTSDGSVDSIVECMKSGAFDYLVKPSGLERLIPIIKRAIESRELQRENKLLKAHAFSHELEHPGAFSDIVTNNNAMMAKFRYIEAIAESPKPVLITGESGVGKELIAKAIHNLSKLKGSFIAVNVAGLNENIFSDTLFGHVKGAFTGAEKVRPGLIEQAKGGTLLLDEIGDLSLATQIKLLRLIQEREYFPLGADNPKISYARLVFSTNLNLKVLQESGTFRKDLYYRLSTHQIHIPPLRERLDDLPLLIEHFIHEASESLGKEKPGYNKELYTLFRSYHFPGNLRELQEMIFDAVSRHKTGKLSLQVFNSRIFPQITESKNPPESFSQEDGSLLYFKDKLPTLKQAAESVIDEALKRADGSQSLAARYLGISQQALSKRLNKRNQLNQ